MSSKINLTYCGMDGSGATVREAKQDAARKIESALAGSYAPFVIRHGGRIAFIWREPIGGYAYKILHDETERGHLYGNSGAWDETEAKRHCARHMAQLSGTYDGLNRHLNNDDRRQIDSYFSWQSRYAEAKSRGMDDDAARTFADCR